jgi:hypothetical protein
VVGKLPHPATSMTRDREVSKTEKVLGIVGRADAHDDDHRVGRPFDYRDRVALLIRDVDPSQPGVLGASSPLSASARARLSRAMRLGRVLVCSRLTAPILVVSVRPRYGANVRPGAGRQFVIGLDVGAGDGSCHCFDFWAG